MTLKKREDDVRYNYKSDEILTKNINVANAKCTEQNRKEKNLSL